MEDGSVANETKHGNIYSNVTRLVPCQRTISSGRSVPFVGIYE